MANLANLNSEERRILASSKATKISDFNDLIPADRLVQFIKAEKPHFTPRIKKADLFRRVSVTPKRSNLRIAAQSGHFILYGLESPSGPQFEKNSTMMKATIARSAKPEIRKRLERIGIDASALFPEIDKAARRLTERYKKRMQSELDYIDKLFD